MPLKGSGFFWSGLAEGLRENLNPQKVLWQMALLGHKYDRMWDYKQKELEERSKLQKDLLKMKQDFQKEFVFPLQEKNLDIKAFQAWVDKLKTEQDIEKNFVDLLKAQSEITKILINSDAIDEEIAKKLGVNDITQAKTVLKDTLNKVNEKINTYISNFKGFKQIDNQQPVDVTETQQTIIKQTPKIIDNVIKNKKTTDKVPEI